MKSPPYLRDIRYDSEAATILAEAEEWFPRLDDAIALMEFAIVRDPTEGKALTESGNVRLLTAQGAVSIGMPTLTYLYEIERGYITVKEVRVVEAKPQRKN